MSCKLVYVVIVVAVIVFWALANTQLLADTAQGLLKMSNIFIEDACPIPDQIIESLDESLSPSLPEESRQLLQKIRNNEATDCEIWEFLSNLDEEQRKQVNFLELLCDVNDCVSP